jgi:DNA-binding HxlR family transcriptional regulator
MLARVWAMPTRIPADSAAPPRLLPERSGCPIASTLDIVGDKWTLVIIRDLLTGKSQFSQFLASPEGISTNILASRLKALEQAGIVTRTPYQTQPPRHRYALTARGEALLPVLQAICRWGNAQIDKTWTPPAWFMEKRVEPSRNEPERW